MGGNVDKKFRREVMEACVEAWYRKDPEHAKAMFKYLHEITKVEHKRGYSSDKNFYVKLRAPQDLLDTIRNAFQRFHLAPGFGEFDGDLITLYEVCPKLDPRGGNARHNRGRKRR